jgi:hypothetical protein
MVIKNQVWDAKGNLIEEEIIDLPAPQASRQAGDDLTVKALEKKIEKDPLVPKKGLLKEATEARKKSERCYRCGLFQTGPRYPRFYGECLQRKEVFSGSCNSCDSFIEKG